MEITELTREKDPQPRDISVEFTQMSPTEFLDFLRTLRNESLLSIVADWKDEWDARRLKGFLDETPDGQKREASIRATEEEHNLERNVFASGVKWIRTER